MRNRTSLRAHISAQSAASALVASAWAAAIAACRVLGHHRTAARRAQAFTSATPSAIWSASLSGMNDLIR